MRHDMRCMALVDISGNKGNIENEKPVSLNECALAASSNPLCTGGREWGWWCGICGAVGMASANLFFSALNNYVITQNRRPSPKAIKPIYNPFIGGNYPITSSRWKYCRRRSKKKKPEARRFRSTREEESLIEHFESKKSISESFEWSQKSNWCAN